MAEGTIPWPVPARLLELAPPVSRLVRPSPPAPGRLQDVPGVPPAGQVLQGVELGKLPADAAEVTGRVGGTASMLDVRLREGGVMVVQCCI